MNGNRQRSGGGSTRLRRQRRVTEARARLRSALEVFEDLRAAPWSHRARSELEATGLGAGTGDTGALTPQELQIVRLAAAGLSNRQIGERLFLSHRNRRSGPAGTATLCSTYY